MKIKKAKRLLALLLCMALVLGTSTFTMAADSSQSQEEMVQDQEDISQEEAGAEEIQTQTLEEPQEIIAEEPQQEAAAEEVTEEPAAETGAEEMTEEPAAEAGTEEIQEVPAEEAPQEEVTEEPAEEPGQEEIQETPTEEVPQEGVTEEPAAGNEAEGEEMLPEGEAPANDQELEENGAESEEKIAEEQKEDQQQLQYEDEYVWAVASAPEGTFPEGTSLQIGYEDENVYRNITEILRNTITDNAILQCAVQDISFIDGEGNSIEPEQKVEVQITYKQPLEGGDETKKISAYHMVTDTEMYAVNLEESGELIQIDTSDGKTVNGFTVSCNSFSPFALVWEGEKTELQTNTVTEAGPILENTQAETNTVFAGNQEDSKDSVKLFKTAQAAGEGKYKIRMEAYTTGKVTSSTESKPVDIILILDQSGSMDENFGSGFLAPSKQEAMQATVKNFISQVADANEENRLGIVTFASNASVRENLQNAQKNEEDLKRSIDRLGTPGGATNVEAGMREALGILPSSNPERNCAVIVFTDGVPTTSNSYASEVADGAIAYSKQIKDKGATVYTVGIFNGADPTQLYPEGCGGQIGDSWTDNETAAANRYMNYLSSNYNGAVGDGLDVRWEGFLIWGHYVYEITANYPRTTEDNYYLSAENAEDLEDIFEKIADQVTKPDIELGENAYVQDVISDVFELPKGVDQDNIGNYVTVKTSRKNSGAGWGEEKVADGTVVRLSDDGKTITVSGFDFDKNVISEEPRENPDNPDDKEFYGKKLIIEFNVQPKEDFIGGNQVKTNADNSAIYDSNKIKIKEFPKPSVDIPICYEYKAENKSIYIGDTWNEVEQFFDDIQTDGIQYQKSEDGEIYTLDGTNNEYVDIQYTIKQNDKIIGTYIIDSAKATGRWENAGQPDINTAELENCTPYTVVASVNPIYEGAERGIDKVPYNVESPYVHVFVPKISVTDQKVFLGDTVNLNDRVDYKGAGDWVDKTGHTSSNTDPVPEPGKAPNLDFNFDVIFGTAIGSEGDMYSSYTPEADSGFKLIVRREDTKRDISNYSQITNSNPIKCADDCYKPVQSDEEHDFTIHVVAGRIEITKKISSKGNSAIEGDPIFTFKIEKVNDEKVYYRTIRFTDKDSVKKKAEALEGLPKGTYKVTELTTQKYGLTDINTEGSTCDVVETGNKSVTFTIGNNVEETTGRVTYSNDKTGPSTNTDTDTVVNRYVYDDKTKAWKISQIVTPGDDQVEKPVDVGSDSGKN